MIPVHLNETEDQVNDTDDQTADLNKLRKRDHGLSRLKKFPLPLWNKEECTACCLPAAPT